MTAALLLLAAVVSLPSWWTGHPVRWWLLPGLSTLAVALAALMQVTDLGRDALEAPAATAVTGALAAVAVGGPLTVAVLRTVSGRTDLNEAGRHEADQSGGSTARARDVVAAAEVLRGGAWIGALERLAIFGTLVTGWPEGLAVVLAVKGLGRYPELRHPGAAERFIIGTFTSVLWAAGCAGVVTLSFG